MIIDYIVFDPQKEQYTIKPSIVTRDGCYYQLYTEKFMSPIFNCLGKYGYAKEKMKFLKEGKMILFGSFANHTTINSISRKKCRIFYTYKIIQFSETNLRNLELAKEVYNDPECPDDLKNNIYNTPEKCQDITIKFLTN